MAADGRRATASSVLNLVVKADVQGSAEALRESLTALSNDLIRINVIASGVGGITESDATLAAASKARDHRLQRPRRRQRAPGDREQRAGPALLLDHLRRHRPGEAGRFRPARRGDPRGDHRHRRGARRVPQLQVRRGRRLHW